MCTDERVRPPCRDSTVDRSERKRPEMALQDQKPSIIDNLDMVRYYCDLLLRKVHSSLTRLKSRDSR